MCITFATEYMQQTPLLPPHSQLCMALNSWWGNLCVCVSLSVCIISWGNEISRSICQYIITVYQPTKHYNIDISFSIILSTDPTPRTSYCPAKSFLSDPSITPSRTWYLMGKFPVTRKQVQWNHNPWVEQLCNWYISCLLVLPCGL